MTGMSLQGAATPDTDADFGVVTVSEVDNPELIIGGAKTSSVFVRAKDDNSGLIFIGFDSSLSTSNGMFLEASDGIGVDLDNGETQIFFAGDTVGDELRYIYTV